MITAPTLAAFRFGTGLSPRHRRPADGATLLESLTQEAHSPYAVEPWAERLARYRTRDGLRRQMRAGDPQAEAANKQADMALTRSSLSDLRAHVARMVAAPVGFHARLSWFWANHFSAEGRRPTLARARAAFIDDAITPHVTGRFGDMLRAAVLHPVMLIYLDQHRSVGPNSPAGARRGQGLNENLAREVLELHSLGVGSSYDQGDVTELARLLTGVTVTLEEGRVFNPRIAEPALVTVLGKRYGGRVRNLAQVEQALEDLAAHPDTARHIATQLVRHFVSDIPDPTLVAHVADSYARSGGALMAVYGALLDHPAAWVTERGKLRGPMEWMAACARAMDIPSDVIMGLSGAETRQLLMAPMAQMGEAWESVPSPAGHDADSAYWATPQRLAARITWAMALAQQWPGLREPAAFLDSALGDAASDPLRRAAMGAESRAQAVGVILASPDFNRR